MSRALPVSLRCAAALTGGLAHPPQVLLLEKIHDTAAEAFAREGFNVLRVDKMSEDELVEVCSPVRSRLCGWEGRTGACDARCGRVRHS